MARSHRLVFDAEIPPEKILAVAGNARLFTTFWRFVKHIDLDRSPPRVRFMFKRFGVGANFEYDMQVERREHKVTYLGKEGDRWFSVTVEATGKPGGGSRVVVEVQYSGPFEALSEPILKEFGEGIVDGLKAIARSAEKPGESLISDLPRLAEILASGKLLVSRRQSINSPRDVQEVLAQIKEQSRGRQVFARLLAGEACLRILARDGVVLDAFIEDGRVTVKGPAAVEKALDVLPGRTIDLLIMEIPET